MVDSGCRLLTLIDIGTPTLEEALPAGTAIHLPAEAVTPPCSQTTLTDFDKHSDNRPAGTHHQLPSSPILARTPAQLEPHSTWPRTAVTDLPKQAAGRHSMWCVAHSAWSMLMLGCAVNNQAVTLHYCCHGSSVWKAGFHAMSPSCVGHVGANAGYRHILYKACCCSVCQHCAKGFLDITGLPMFE